MLQTGATAPDFALGAWSLAEARSRGAVLLAFFKISCPTCQLAFPFLQRLADQAAEDSPSMVAISQDDAKGTEQFRQRFGISIATELDAAPAYRASNLYGIRNVPTLFLVEPSGEISMAASGFSKAAFEQLGARFGVSVFRPGEEAPEFRPG
jgi:peroxiredoxin